MPATRTTTRAWTLIAAYALLILARLAHAAAPAPDPTLPAPSIPIVAPDCGPCGDPSHDHQPHQAHSDHCPVCQSLRPGAEHCASSFTGAPVAAPAQFIPPDGAPAPALAGALDRRPARAPPAR